MCDCDKTADPGRSMMEIERENSRAGCDRAETQLDVAMRMLHDEIESAHAVASALDSKLEAIMSPETPVCEEKNPCPDPCSGQSHFMCALDGERRSIAHLISRLQYLLHRLEV